MEYTGKGVGVEVLLILVMMTKPTSSWRPATIHLSSSSPLSLSSRRALASSTSSSTGLSCRFNLARRPEGFEARRGGLWRSSPSFFQKGMVAVAAAVQCFSAVLEARELGVVVESSGGL